MNSLANLMKPVVWWWWHHMVIRSIHIDILLAWFCVSCSQDHGLVELYQLLAYLEAKPPIPSSNDGERGHLCIRIWNRGWVACFTGTRSEWLPDCSIIKPQQRSVKTGGCIVTSHKPMILTKSWLTTYIADLQSGRYQTGTFISPGSHVRANLGVRCYDLCKGLCNCRCSTART